MRARQRWRVAWYSLCGRNINVRFSPCQGVRAHLNESKLNIHSFYLSSKCRPTWRKVLLVPLFAGSGGKRSFQRGSGGMRSFQRGSVPGLTSKPGSLSRRFPEIFKFKFNFMTVRKREETLIVTETPVTKKDVGHNGQQCNSQQVCNIKLLPFFWASDFFKRSSLYMVSYLFTPIVQKVKLSLLKFQYFLFTIQGCIWTTFVAFATKKHSLRREIPVAHVPGFALLLPSPNLGPPKARREEEGKKFELSSTLHTPP